MGTILKIFITIFFIGCGSTGCVLFVDMIFSCSVTSAYQIAAQYFGSLAVCAFIIFIAGIFSWYVWNEDWNV